MTLHNFQNTVGVQALIPYFKDVSMFNVSCSTMSIVGHCPFESLWLEFVESEPWMEYKYQSKISLSYL